MTEVSMALLRLQESGDTMSWEANDYGARKRSVIIAIRAPRSVLKTSTRWSSEPTFQGQK